MTNSIDKYLATSMNILQTTLYMTHLSTGKITPTKNWTPQGETGSYTNSIYIK